MSADQIIRQVAAMRAQVPQLDLCDRARFIANMVFVHQVIVASEALIEMARDGSDDPALRRYFDEHLEEERGHAAWLAEDLESMGVHIAAAPRSRIAVAMAGSMYYMVRHVSPRCLLGYMLVLECFPAPFAVVDALERAHGAKALRTVRHHAEHDIDHGAELRQIVDAFDAPEIELCAIETARYINEFTLEIA